jgi:hypothetical protein
MGKSSERATKESAPRGHASPFFKSGGSRAAFFQPKLAINTPGDHLEQEADRTAERVLAAPAGHAPETTSSGKAAASVQRQPKDQSSGVVTEGLSLTYEQMKDQPGFEEWKEKQTAALKFKLWEHQPTELKVGLIGFGLSSAGILGTTLALDPHYRRETIDALQDTNILLPLSLLPYSEYFPLSGFKYKLPTAANAPYTFQTEFDFDAWFKLAREKWNIPKVSLGVGVDSAYRGQSGFSPLTGGHIKLKFGGGIVNLTGFINEPLPPTPMLISDPTRGEPPVWLMRSLPGQLESNLPRGSGVFLTVDVLRLPELFKSEPPKRDTAVQRKEGASGDGGGAAVATPAVSREFHSGAGEALPGSTLAFMEKRFGHDFSDVRVHRSEHAAESAESINARAYTSGNDIVFNSGEYQPHTPSGQRLLAHELTHVIQQGGARPSRGARSNGAIGAPVRPAAAVAGGTTVQRFQIEGPFDINDPVHETLVQESLKKAGLLDAKGTYTSKEAWEYVRGVMWNDDPRGQLFDANKKRTDDYSSGVEWYTQFKDFEKRAAKGEKFGPGASLLARTHFGDMQALHGMASEDNEAPQVTQDKIMMWCEFTYRVAIGDIAETAKLSSVTVPGFSAMFGSVKGLGDQTVRAFFGIREVGNTTKRAAGSLLHTVQDSYAGGHTEREDIGGGRRGKIKSFHSYAHQDHDKHGHSDEFQGGKTAAEQIKRLPGGTDAMEQGAVVLQYIAAKKPWPEMKLYLEQNVFATVASPTSAGAGADYLPDPKPKYIPPPRDYGPKY